MSFDALRWALAQPVGKSSAKFVLVALADCVNDESSGSEMLCWPSTSHVCEITCLDRKTVIDAMKRLRDHGYVVDTGARKGSTGQVPVYRLNSPESGTVEQSQKRNSTESGTVPDFPAKGPVFPVKESRFSRQTVPKTGHGTRKEPGRNQERNQEGRAQPAKDLPIPEVSPVVLSDYLAVRRSKKAGPITETVIAGFKREAALAGITVEQAVTTCCEAGWTGFKADWYARRSGQAGPADRQNNRQTRQRIFNLSDYEETSDGKIPD